MWVGMMVVLLASSWAEAMAVAKVIRLADSLEVSLA